MEGTTGNGPGGPASESHGPTPPPASFAWENRQELGFIPAMVETLKGTALSPDSYFRSMPREGGIGNPLLYAIVIGWIGVIFQQIWSSLVGLPFAGLLGSEDMMAGYVISSGMTFFWLIIAPVWITLGIFILSGIYHLVLMMVGGQKYPFETTLRTVCYCSGPSLLNAIPFCGGLIAMVWTIVISILALPVTQETTRGKSAIAVLAPLIICCGLMFVVGGFFATLLGLAASSSN